MKRRDMSVLALTGLLALTLPGPDAAAQSTIAKDQLIGTWTLASLVNVRADGSKFDPYNGKATGTLLLDKAGQFSWMLIRSDIPKMASGNRLDGTADEFKAVAHGTLAYFGTYSLDASGTTMTMKIQHSSFANFNGAEQKRTLALAGDELTVTNSAGASGGTAHVTWKRLP